MGFSSVGHGEGIGLLINAADNKIRFRCLIAAVRAVEPPNVIIAGIFGFQQSAALRPFDIKSYLETLGVSL